MACLHPAAAAAFVATIALVGGHASSIGVADVARGAIAVECAGFEADPARPATVGRAVRLGAAHLVYAVAARTDLCIGAFRSVVLQAVGRASAIAVATLPRRTIAIGILAERSERAEPLECGDIARFADSITGAVAAKVVSAEATCTLAASRRPPRSVETGSVVRREVHLGGGRRQQLPPSDDTALAQAATTQGFRTTAARVPAGAARCRQAAKGTMRSPKRHASGAA